MLIIFFSRILLPPDFYFFYFIFKKPSNTQNMSFNLKDFCFMVAKDCSTFVISPLDGL